MIIEGEALLGVEGVGAWVVLEDPQVRRSRPDRRMQERRSQAAAGSVGRSIDGALTDRHAAYRGRGTSAV